MSLSKIEYRTLLTEFEVRAGKDVNTVHIEGYAAKWNTRSQNLGGFVEEVAQGAFTKTIQEADIRALINHKESLILGRNRAQTLELSEDTEGLHYRVTADRRQSYVNDLAIAMERGDVTQSSFGFRTILDGWGLTDDDFPLRTLREVALFDVSPVTYPAYTSSTSGVGSRALERLAELRGLPLDTVEADIAGAIRSDGPEESRDSFTLPDADLSLPIDPMLAIRALQARSR